VGLTGTLDDQQQFAKLLRHLHRHDWVVYAKPACGGPVQVLRYLGRCTHRVAISNHPLLAFQQERVTFGGKETSGSALGFMPSVALSSSYADSASATMWRRLKANRN